MPETELWERAGFIRKEARVGEWTVAHSNALIAIVQEESWLFLDENRDKLLFATQKLWSASFIWEKMSQLGLSLQVVTYIARQRDEEQRSNYRSALEALVNDAQQVVFLDETG